MLHIFTFILSLYSEPLDKVDQFTENDYQTDVPILVFIYYKRETYTCPLCFFLSQQIVDLKNIEIRKLNFFEDPYNGSRFCTLFFPSLIIYDHKRSHCIEVFDSKALQDIIDAKKWSHKRCRKFVNNPSSWVVKFYAFTVYIFYKILNKLYFIFDKIPTYVYSIFIGVMISVCVIILIQMVMEILSKKEKED